MGNLTKSKLLLFDYDGTIVDSAKMIVRGAIEAFRMCGMPDPDPKKVKENIGKTLAVALKAYMPEGFNVTPSEISNAYKKWYAEQGRLGLQNEPIFPGMKRLLTHLKKTNNYYLAVATNKSRVALDNGLKKHNLTNYFDLTLTTDETEPKPNPEMAFSAMRKFRIDNKSTMIIGDTISDIGLGKNSQIITVGVSWGYNEVSVLKSHGADYIISSPEEFFNKLESNYFFS